MAAVLEVGTGITFAMTGAPDIHLLDLKFPKIERAIADITPLNSAATASGAYYAGVKIAGKLKRLDTATAKAVYDQAAIETAVEAGFATVTITYIGNGSLSGSACIKEVGAVDHSLEKELTCDITFEFAGALTIGA